MPSVGQELLDTPFPDMVAKLAMGIAQAQHALDENSVNTAVILADTNIDVVLGVTQVIAAGRHGQLRAVGSRVDLADPDGAVAHLLPVLGGLHRGVDGHQDHHLHRDEREGCGGGEGGFRGVERLDQG